jgi:hypothetical protein
VTIGFCFFDAKLGAFKVEFGDLEEASDDAGAASPCRSR